MPSKNEKILACASPFSMVVGGYIFWPLMFVIPVVIYVYSKRESFEFSMRYALRVIDMYVSLILCSAIAGVGYAAVEIVEKDAGNPDSIWILGNETLRLLFMVVMGGYLLITTSTAVYRSLVGKEYRYMFSFRLFERMRDK